jgi:sugar phosphate isomerase/epimerase
MILPKLACPNFIADAVNLREFARENGFAGIDWSFTLDDFPDNPAEEEDLIGRISCLEPLEVRYHCAFKKVDFGNMDDVEDEKAMNVFKRVCDFVSTLRGDTLTIHLGLGQENTDHLFWDRAIDGLAELVRFARKREIRLCLENLAWGWTSRPQLFEKFLRRTDCWATLDIGHARVSPYVVSRHYDLEDFVVPYPDRFLNAHIYHEEVNDEHIPPKTVQDIEDRLRLLRRLPHCDWWVLELREETALLQTRNVIREFMDTKFL